MVSIPLEPSGVSKIIEPEGVWASIPIAVRAKQKAPPTANFLSIRVVYVMSVSSFVMKKFLVNIHYGAGS
jgi:hypothetical protein